MHFLVSIFLNKHRLKYTEHNQHLSILVNIDIGSSRLVLFLVDKL
jgi:hypothetical protein